jgi:hypothetical protein
MPKAILELEMPENCWDCPLVQGRELSPTTWCGYSGKDCPAPAYQSRRSDCPLKLVKGCEYCNTEPEIIYRKDWTIFTKGEDKVVDINYCPMCGRRLEVEP